MHKEAPMEKITSEAKDLEQEFKDAAMKLLKELKTKKFEGEGTPIKENPQSVVSEEVEQKMRVSKTKERSSLGAGKPQRPGSWKRSGSIEVVGEKGDSRSSGRRRATRKAAMAPKPPVSKSPSADLKAKQRVAAIKKARKFKKIKR